MDINIHFCDSERDMIEWIMQLEAQGTKVRYHTQIGPPSAAEVGDIRRHIIARNAGGGLGVKSSTRYESAAGKFVVISRIEPQ